LVLINGLLAFLLAAHVYENVVDDEHWPFCSYPMYSELEEADSALTTYRIIGVRPDGKQLAEIGRLIDAGTIKVSVEATYPLAELAKAHQHVEGGHTRGKVVVVP